MNPRRKISCACALVWTILGFVVSSNGRPSDVNDSGLTELRRARSVNADNEPAGSSDSSTVSDGKTVGNVASVVPQVGYLEGSSEVGNIGKDPLSVIIASPTVSDSGVDQPAGNAGNGILVPIVSVVDGDSSKSNNGIVNHPLVALLPAPSGAGQDSTPQIPSLPVIQAELTKPENRRSARADGQVDKSSEIMDVAEDIVFRPLFAVRQAAGKSPRNFRRNYRPNYRRYNVNGYYRIPNNNYYRSNNNRDGVDYSDD